MGCLTTAYDYLDSFLISTLGPLAAVGFVALISAMRAARRAARGDDARVAWSQGKYAVVVLTFCVLPQSSTAIFRTFQ